MGRHVLVTSLPAHGHVNPTLPVVAELVSRGHRVTYATHVRFAPAVTATGATFLPVDFDLPPEPPVDEGGLRFSRRLELFAGLVEHGLPPLLEFARRDRPDLVCYDAMTPTGRLVAECLRLPGVGLVATFASNRHTTAAGGWHEHGPDRRALARVLPRLRALAQRFGVAMSSILMTPPAAPSNVVFLPREFQVAGETFDDSHRFVGPCLGGRVEAAYGVPGDGRPLLYVALGTAANRPDILRACVTAFRRTDWRVVMALGPYVDRATLGDLPPHWDVRPVQPQPAVLRHADVFLSHAGMNSVMEALYCGVPIVAVPQRVEQLANARRVEELGLGRRLGESDLDPATLVRVVDGVHRNPVVRDRLGWMRRAIDTAGGETAAADAIEERLPGPR